MTRIRVMQAATPLLAILLLSNCSNELAPTAVARVTLRPSGTWPDTLGVAELATVLADVVTSSGQTISGVELQWSSSDSSIIQVIAPDTSATPSAQDRLNIGRRAVITSHATGTATVIARLDRPGFAPVELRVPVAVKQRNWPTLLTVSNVDTVGLDLTNADPAVIGTLAYTWSSSDPSVLQAIAVGTDPSRALLTARANGPAQVTLTVTSDRIGRVVFQQPFTVGSVTITQQPQWPSLLPVTNTVQLGVAVLDATGQPAVGAHVTWSSTNLSAFTVDSNGVVTALSRGGGEVVAQVGAAPFQVAQLRATLQVVQKWGAVSAGGNHTCAIAALDGTGYCWGNNASGELGTGFAAAVLPQASLPRLVATSHKFSELKAAESHSCGREGALTLLCWGARDRGQLGDGPCVASGMGTTCFPSSESPVIIVNNGALGTGQVHLDQVVVGGSFSCIVVVNGGSGSFASRKLRCWGTADQQGMGIAFSDSATNSPVLTPGLSPNANITQVTAGLAHLCTRTDDIFWVECMGVNDVSQLGDGTVGNPPGPPLSPKGFVIVGGNPANPGGDGYPANALTAGGNHTCGLDGIGILCWGDGVIYPTRVVLAAQVTSFAAGDAHSCALVTTGDAWCWGSNSNGQLGGGTIGGSSAVPTLVTGGLKFVALTAGTAHTCGVTTDGSVYCWGSNFNGQLGDGTTTDRAAPVRVGESPQ